MSCKNSIGLRKYYNRKTNETGFSIISIKMYTDYRKQNLIDLCSVSNLLNLEFLIRDIQRMLTIIIFRV